MWRVAEAVGGKFQGGAVPWREIGCSREQLQREWNRSGNSWDLSAARLHEKSKAPYIWNAGSRKFLGFENPASLEEKVRYATDKWVSPVNQYPVVYSQSLLAKYTFLRNIGGLMIWALDQDDDANTLLNIVSSAGLCAGGSGDSIKHTCVPIEDVSETLISAFAV